MRDSTSLCASSESETVQAAAGFFTALSVACPVSGHHPFGAWWFGQMVCALAMLGGSVFALNRSVHHDAEVRAPELDHVDV